MTHTRVQSDVRMKTEATIMKAAVTISKNHLQIQERLIPRLSPGEALIRVAYCGICGTDVHVFHGQHPTATFPVIPGHEFVGELVDFSGETRLERGMMVAAQPVFSCGVCEACARGQDNVCQSLRIHGCHVDGGFAEYVRVPLRKVFALPEGVDLQLAALVEPLAVAVHDVRRSNLQVGESALVIGGGPIGLLIAAVARHAGASVILSETAEYRRKHAESLGFPTLNPGDPDFEQALSKAGADGFNVVFEVSGSRAGITTAVDHVKTAGTVMIIGMSSEPWPVSLSKIFMKEATLQGVRVHSQINFMGALELMKSGAVDDVLHSMISAVYPLEEAAAALDHAQSGGAFFKILIEV